MGMRCRHTIAGMGLWGIRESHIRRCPLWVKSQQSAELWGSMLLMDKAISSEGPIGKCNVYTTGRFQNCFGAGHWRLCWRCIVLCAGSPQGSHMHTTCFHLADPVCGWKNAESVQAIVAEARPCACAFMQHTPL